MCRRQRTEWTLLERVSVVFQFDPVVYASEASLLYSLSLLKFSRMLIIASYMAHSFLLDLVFVFCCSFFFFRFWFLVFCFVLSFFSGPHSWHMEVPRLGLN